MGGETKEGVTVNKISKIDFLIEEGLKNDFAKICKSRGQTMTWVLNNMVQQFIKVRNYEARKEKSRAKAKAAVN